MGDLKQKNLIPHETDEALDSLIEALLDEAGTLADDYDCFIEAHARAMDGSDRHW